MLGYTNIFVPRKRWCRVRCASGCTVECWICNREVAGSNLGLGYFAPRSTQPSIPPGSVNEYQLRLGRRRRQVWLIPLADETQGVQVKLCYPLTMPKRLRDTSCGNAIQIVYLYGRLYREQIPRYVLVQWNTTVLRSRAVS